MCKKCNHNHPPKSSIADAIIAVAMVPIVVVWSLTGN